MNDEVKKLALWGCDTIGALERMLNDEEFYLDCINAVVADPAFENLGKALQNKDRAAGFDCAHSLKGIVANTGLTPLLNIVVKIVEPLREEAAKTTPPDFDALLVEQEKLMKTREELIALLQ